MISYLPIQNDKPVMEYLRPLHLQYWILCIEISRIPVRKLCARICIYFHTNTIMLLSQNVQRIHIDISVDKDYLILCFLDDRCDQAERIIDLSVEKIFLLRFCMILNVLKHLVKLLILAFLVIQLFQFYISNLLEEKRIAGYKVAHLNKYVHYTN